MKCFSPLAFLILFNSVEASDYDSREDVKLFVQEMAAEELLNEKELLSIFSKAEFKQNIIDAISRPAERVLNWAQYQDIFLTERRITEGLEFLRENGPALRAAEEKYGVPPHIVTSIIGVETMYGRIKGGYKVLDALVTLAFDYPPRSKFFRRELKHLILLAKEEQETITELKGSYAGAMGLGQFMPSSYRAYAVDFDGDGFRDIWNNPSDAIGSVANYLAKHGWRRDSRVTISVDGKALRESLFNVSLRPSVSVWELRRMGLHETSLEASEMVSPIRLEGKRGVEFWLGLQNFYVITRYNHSRLYAMAVHQLSQNLKEVSAELASL